MKIIVYGTGCCANCEKLYQNVLNALKDLGKEATVEKITDMEVIVSKNIMALPALSVDGNVIMQGKKLSESEVKKLLADI